MSEAAKPAEEGKKKKGGSKKLLVIIIAAVVLLGGAAGGFFFWKSRAEAATAAAAEGGEKHQSKEKKTEEGGAVLTLEPFVVNLADNSGSRFLRVSLRLVIGDKEAAPELQEDEVKMLRIRSSILEFLSQQLADELVTAEGKEKVKKEIAERANKVLGEDEVVDVLFSEFVVQF